MWKKKNTRLVTGTFALTLLLAFMFTLTVNAFNKPQQRFDEVIVHKNDTLWEIAERVTPNNGDVRDTVYNIRKVNNLSSVVLQPGQRLLVPR